MKRSHFERNCRAQLIAQVVMLVLRQTRSPSYAQDAFRVQKNKNNDRLTNSQNGHVIVHWALTVVARPPRARGASLHVLRLWSKDLLATFKLSMCLSVGTDSSAPPMTFSAGYCRLGISLIPMEMHRPLTRSCWRSRGGVEKQPAEERQATPPINSLWWVFIRWTFDL